MAPPTSITLNMISVQLAHFIVVFGRVNKCKVFGPHNFQFLIIRHFSSTNLKRKKIKLTSQKQIKMSSTDKNAEVVAEPEVAEEKAETKEQIKGTKRPAEVSIVEIHK
jgi:hypothetical protein